MEAHEGQFAVPLPRVRPLQGSPLKSPMPLSSAPPAGALSADMPPPPMPPPPMAQLLALPEIIEPTQATQATQQQTQPPALLVDPSVVCRLICATGQMGYVDLRLKPDSKERIHEWVFGRNDKCDYPLPRELLRLLNKHFKVWYSLEDKNLMVQDLLTNGTYVNNQRLVKGLNYILTQGDELAVGIGVSRDIIRWIVIFPNGNDDGESDRSGLGLLYTPLKNGIKRGRGELQLEPAGVHKDFIINKEIVGQGAFATVKKAIERATGKTYAVKIISKRKVKAGGVAVDRELEVLRQLNHPGVVRLKAFYEDVDNYYLVIEYVPGGDLMDFVAAHGAVGEEAAREITRQVLEAIEYVHRMGISHRDLKPDNILIAKDDPVEVKITDFGLAKGTDQALFMKTFCGTLAYVAPEIVASRDQRHQRALQVEDQHYLLLVDMWLLGCLVFVILTAHLPFSGSTQEELFKLIRRGVYHTLLLAENGVSTEGRDFLDCLLCVDPLERYTASRALRHPWITEHVELQPVVLLSQSQSQHKRESQRHTRRLQLGGVEEEAEEGPEEDAGAGVADQSDASVIEQGSSHFKVPVPPAAAAPVEIGSSLPGGAPGSQAPPGTYLTLEPLPNSVYTSPIHLRQGVNPYLVGRHDNVCHTIIHDDRILKIHCAISKKRHPVEQTTIYELPAQGLEDVWLVDNLTNLCYLNNQKMGKGTKAKLFNGDKVLFFVDSAQHQQLGFTVHITDTTGLFPGEADDTLRMCPQDSGDRRMFLRAQQLVVELVMELKRRSHSVLERSVKRARVQSDVKRPVDAWL